MSTTWPRGDHHPGQGDTPAANRCSAGPGSWLIRQWRSNRSAFNGYRPTPSAYSEVVCTECRTRWRTKAAYADQLRMEPGGEF